MLKQLEQTAIGQQVDLSAMLNEIKFNAEGLIPAVAQQHDSGQVLMLAWMNRQAIVETLNTGQVCYWSRSRQAYWRKGETSGHRQKLITAYLDCDADTLLLKVDQTGPACHTERRSCFYLQLNDEQVTVVEPPD